MAAPKHPGGNAGKGRPLGAPNKATAAVREVAQLYTLEAIEVLAGLMRDPTAPHAARVSAASALLDRGHGRPRQELEHSGPDGKELAPAETDPSRLALSILEILRGVWEEDHQPAALEADRSADAVQLGRPAGGSL